MQNKYKFNWNLKVVKYLGVMVIENFTTLCEKIIMKSRQKNGTRCLWINYKNESCTGACLFLPFTTSEDTSNVFPNMGQPLSPALPKSHFC